MTSKRLDIVSNVAVVLTCVVVSGVVLMRYFDTRRTDAASQLSSTIAYAPGEPIEQIPGVTFAETPVTALLFLRSTCHFCTESMPFYARLQAAAAGLNGRARTVAVSSENVDVTKRYLDDHGLKVGRIVSWQTRRVPATPTLILVDSRGNVMREWVGLLNKTVEDEALSSVRTAAVSSR